MERLYVVKSISTHLKFLLIDWKVALIKIKKTENEKISLCNNPGFNYGKL